MKARAVRVLAKSEMSVSACSGFEPGEVLVEKPQEMMRGVAKDRVLFHPRGGEGKDERSRMPPSGAMVRPRVALGETAPDFGTRHVGAQIVHVDAVLAQQGQHVLRGLHQLRRVAVLERAAQRVETGLDLPPFRGSSARG